MFGTKGTTSAQPAAKKPAPPPAKPAPAQQQRDTGRRGSDDTRQGGKRTGLLCWLIRIFSILLLLFAPFVLFFLIAILINPNWVSSMLGCENNCILPLRYIWPILICFLAQVIAALFSLLWADSGNRTTCMIFAIVWIILLIFGIILYFLSKDWIVLVCAIGLAILWTLKTFLDTSSDSSTSQNRR